MPSGRRDSGGHAQPGRRLAEHPLELRFHAAPGDPFHERELDRLEQLPPLPREIRESSG